MILAHPFRRRFYEHDNIEKKVDQFLQDPVLKMVDTIETMNGRGKDRQNQFSMALGEKLGWQGIGGSDAHYARNIPSCATRFQKKIRNIDELIEELKAGRYQPVDLRRPL